MRYHAIEIDNYRKVFKGKVLLDITKLIIEKNELVGIIGENGSGKTMLLKAICGFVHPDNGSIRVNGLLVGHDVDYPSDIGFILDGTSFIQNLTGLQNLIELALIRKRIGVADVRRTMESLGLDPDDKRKYAYYSTGMKKRLSIAQAIMENPDILLLDEPFSGLDGESKERVKSIIDLQRQSGKTIIIVEHNLEDLVYKCSHVYSMHDGKIDIVNNGNIA